MEKSVDSFNIYRVKQCSTRKILLKWRYHILGSETRETLERLIVTTKGKMIL